jgi:hypothetical protein
MLLPDLHLARDDNEFILTWPTGNPDNIGSLSIAISNIRDQSGDPYGEFHAEIRGGGHLFGYRKASLVGTTTVDSLAKIMAAKCGAAWGETLKDREDQCKGIFSQVIDAVLTAWRAGEPLIDLSLGEEVGAVTYAIDPLVPEDTNIYLFGPPSAMKGWITAAMVLCWITHRDMPGGVKVNSNGNDGALYIDYEDSEKELRRRIQWLARGWGITIPPGKLWYKQMWSPIATHINELRKMVKANNIGLVAIDSMGPASGGDINSNEVAIQASNAIRRLSPANRVIIAHISKAERRGDTKDASIIGGIFFDALARGSYKVEKEDKGDEDYLVGCYQAKLNTGQRKGNVAFRLKFYDQTHTAHLTAANIADMEASYTSLGGSVRDRILMALRDGGMSRKDLLDKLDGVKQDTLNKAIARELDKKNPAIVSIDGKYLGLAAQDIPF